MKSISLALMALVLSMSLIAQHQQTSQGNVVIETNNTIGATGGVLGSSGTGFLLTKYENGTIWNIGGEAGYFVAENIALKIGLGYGNYDGSSLLSYMFGLKYYAAGMIPIQVDYSMQKGDDFFFEGETPSYLGFTGGYAFFIGDMISVEPAIRYNLSLNKDFYENFLQAQIGFSIFL